MSERKPTQDEIDDAMLAEVDDGDGDDDDFDCAGFFDGNGRWTCGKIGSEECDWSCPHSHEIGKR